MSISQYIKEIGRGKDGARALSREQAADLMGQLLDGGVTDLEVGAFCLAMRIKGETPDEMAGFLDATHSRLQHLQHPSQQHTLHNPPGNHTPAVVLPSYNGARKLPVLTPLLALLLAREGLAVLVHGYETENNRVSAQKVLSALGIKAIDATSLLISGQVHFCPTERLHPGLRRLLDVRRVVGLRNPAHSLVKLMMPVAGPAILVSSYTHPEYLHAMTATLGLMHTPALLLRGTEGEPVADARRTPAMDAFLNGQVTRVQEAQSGSLTQLPDLPDTSPSATADWISQVMAGALPIPTPIAMQVAHITALARASAAQPSRLTTQPTPQPA